MIERQLTAKLKADDQYWREVSQGRGGAGEVSAMWFAGKVRATEDQPDWMPRQLGYTVMEARIVPTISNR